MSAEGRRRWAARLGVTGAGLGVAAGVVQAVAGYGIPEWTGAKQAYAALGLLTVGLSGLAGLAARRQRRPDLSRLGRAACALGLIGPGLLCLTTVGRLWYLPAVLLVVAGGLALDRPVETAVVLGRDWGRLLLSGLGAGELLMAAGSGPLLGVVGGLGGLALIVAAWWRTAPRAALVGLLVAGTVPFAALGLDGPRPRAARGDGGAAGRAARPRRDR